MWRRSIFLLHMKGPFEPHRILGLQAPVTRAEVVAQYYKLCKKYHPDLRLPTSSTERMQDINAAYRHLLAQTEMRDEARPPIRPRKGVLPARSWRKMPGDQSDRNKIGDSRPRRNLQIAHTSTKVNKLPH